MSNDLITKIDTLIEMSKSPSNYDTLKTELIENQNEIDTKKKEIDDLRASMQDEKYVKASDRIIDENIKVSLELKIQKLEGNLKTKEKALKKLIKQENTLHATLESFQEKVSKLTKLLSILEMKSASLKENDTEIKNYYENLIKDTEKKLEIAKKSVTEIEEEYQVISRKLTDQTTEIDEQKTKIQEEKEKLFSTMKNLNTNEDYIDKEQRDKDEKRLQDLKDRIAELEKRKDEILKDPVYIGQEAKELLIEDDRTGAIEKIKELVKYIKSLPYMDIDTSMDAERVLKEALESAINERDEFAALIENKQYSGNDTEIIIERQNYLEEQKQKVEKELESVQNEIRTIDTLSIQKINSLLSAAIIVQETLKKELQEYDHVINEESENATPKKKAVLITAYQKKEEELQVIQEIIDSYETEMEELMLHSKKLEEERAKELIEKIEKLDKRMKDITKKAIISSKAADVLAVENDKARLKELNDNIKNIIDRQKFKQTPNEVYDEIEMILGSFIEPRIKSNNEVPKIVENDFRIMEEIVHPEEELTRSEKNKELLKQDEVKQMKESINEVIDIPWNTEVEKVSSPVMEKPILPPMPEFPVIEEPSVLEDYQVVEPVITPAKEIEPVKHENVVQEPILMSTPVTERWKVIGIEDLNPETPKNKPEVKHDDILIGDFKDDDYISFDSIVGGNQP